MRLFGLVVGRNEADRYLMSMLAHLTPLVDECFFFDDDSDDDTAVAADHFGCRVVVRGPNETSFAEHEGKFRSAAWNAFEKACEPVEGDWVLSVDTDEVVVGPELVENLRYRLPRVAADDGFAGIILPIGEVFAVANGRPQVRVDGYWGTISAPRLFAYRPGGTYADRKMACGSEPTYVTTGAKLVQNDISILHYGHLDPADRLERFQRYSGVGGHAENHVASIVAPAVTKPWPARAPVLSRELQVAQ